MKVTPTPTELTNVVAGTDYICQNISDDVIIYYGNAASADAITNYFRLDPSHWFITGSYDTANPVYVWTRFGNAQLGIGVN